MPAALIVTPAAQTEVALEPIARERASVLQNLFELYVHDFSEQVPLQLQESGRFELSPGEVWWTRDDHFPFWSRTIERWTAQPAAISSIAIEGVEWSVLLVRWGAVPAPSSSG